MNYLFLGEDSLSKNVKINELKQKILTSPEALKFDYESLYAHRLKAEDFKKTLVSLPAVSKKRLVIVRECHKLSVRNKDLAVTFVREPYSPTILILDSDNLDEQNSFVRKLKQYVKIVQFKRKPGMNVFNLTKAIGLHRTPEALKILFQLLKEGTHPLQVMGGLAWFWGRARRQLPFKTYKKGLVALQEADYNIKRSRLKPEHALEMLVVKLCLAEEILK